MEVNLDPAGRLLDLHALLVVWAPPLDEGEPQLAQPPQVVHPDLDGPGGRRDIGRVGLGILVGYVTFRDLL